MNWNSVSDFFAMGGYGLHVWGSYAVTLAAMLFEPWRVHIRHHRAREQLAHAAASEE